MRPFQKRRYLMAFLLTAALFGLGFFFGFLIDLQRIDYFSSVNENQKMSLRSMQLQYELMDYLASEGQCDVLRKVFDTSALELDKNRVRIERYTQQSKIKKEEFEMTRREYVLSQIHFWRVSKKLKEHCPEQSDFITILYFFSDDKTCPECGRQEVILSYYKEQLKQNLLVFALDEKFDDKEPLISLLKQAYYIEEYPYLVIEEEKYSGLIREDELKSILCRLYNHKETRKPICD